MNRALAFGLLAVLVGTGPSVAQTAPPAGSRAQSLVGDIDPKLADLTDKVWFGDVWERPGRSKRDRIPVTVTALIVLIQPDQLRSHLGRTLNNGVSKEELAETVTQLAFYAGWPAAVSAVPILRDVLHAKGIP